MTIEVEGGRVTVQGKARATKKKGKAAATSDPAPSEATTTFESPAHADPAVAPSRRGKKRAADTTPDVPASLNAVTPGHDAKLPEEPPEFTLADLAAGYLQHLEASGKSKGTIASYSLELAVAMEELGKDTPVSQLTAERVRAFFESERVTKTRSGRGKSPLSIAKTRRVLSQAIGWGVAGGMVDAAVTGPR